MPTLEVKICADAVTFDMMTKGLAVKLEWR